MEKLVVLLGIVGAFMFFMDRLSDKIKAKNRKNDKKTIYQDKNFEYAQRGFILTQTEIEFHKQLKEELPDYMEISLNVRVADILRTKESNDFKAFDEIKSLSVDFLIYKKENFEILFAIELDDRTHDLEHRRKTDNSKNKAFKSAGLPLYRIKVEKFYKEKINDILDSWISFNLSQ